jgi:hypothetical protein
VFEREREREKEIITYIYVCVYCIVCVFGVGGGGEEGANQVDMTGCLRESGSRSAATLTASSETSICITSIYNTQYNTQINTQNII